MATELVGALVKVLQDLCVFEIPLIEQGLHRHVHFVAQETVDGNLGKHADSLLDIGP